MYLESFLQAVFDLTILLHRLIDFLIEKAHCPGNLSVTVDRSAEALRRRRRRRRCCCCCFVK